MAGVLPATGTRGGLLGQFEQRRPRLAGFLGDNSSALMQFGMGLLSGGNRGEAWANASQGLAYGSQADQARRQRTQEEEEQTRQQEARNNLLMSPEFQSLSAEDRAWMLANPDAADQFIASDIQRRTTPAAGPEPTDDMREYQFAVQQGFPGTFQEWQNPAGATTREMREDANGILRYVDTQDPVFPGVEPAPEPGYRPLTDPAERLERGIAADDTRPYQISPSGQVSPIGGSGVTINNGTVDERRYALLYRTAVDELPIIEETFGALGEIGNQAADRLPEFLSRFLVSEDYKRATNAVIAVIQAQTYAMTGAAAPESEAQRLASLMMPALNDGPEVIADKLERIRRAIANLGSYSDVGATSPGGAPGAGTGPRVAPPAAAPTTGAPGAEGWVDLGDGIRYRVVP